MFLLRSFPGPRAACALLLASLLAACGGGSSGSGDGSAAAVSPAEAPAAAGFTLFLPLTDLLPPLVPPTASEDHSARCGTDGLICLRWVEARLAEWEARFGCDHRAVFPTVYRMLTRQARLQMERDAASYDDPAGLGYEAVKFYELYEEMITAQMAGEPLPPAWETAMSAAVDGDWTGAHDMLLAINAHVQRDMPFAVASVGIGLPDGRSRKRDHDRFNIVLNEAYPDIVREVGRRYDPLMLTVADLGLIGNLAAQQLVAVWREGVWRNAERLTVSDGTALDAPTRASIELQAEATARLLKVGEIPGRRAMREAYCQAALAAG